MLGEKNLKPQTNNENHTNTHKIKMLAINDA